MSKNKLSKKTLYFLIAVIVFVILPLLIIKLTKDKPNNNLTSNAAASPSSNASIENKVNQYIENNGNLTNPWNKKQESAKDMPDEIIGLKRDPFLITKHVAESLSIPGETSSEGNPGDPGQAQEETEKTKKDLLEGLELKGVLIEGGKKSALINDKLCYENEDIKGMKIISIKEGDVELDKDGTTYILRIKE